MLLAPAGQLAALVQFNGSTERALKERHVAVGQVSAGRSIQRLNRESTERLVHAVESHAVHVQFNGSTERALKAKLSVRQQEGGELFNSTAQQREH